MTSSAESCDAPASPLFLTTRWSVVLTAQDAASPDAVAALEALCRAYWYPLYVYVRRSGHDSHDAQDLTQEFFARLLEKGWLNSADQERGRFRTFLIVALKRFLAREWHREMTQRRGGGFTFLDLDTAAAELRYAREPELAADQAFERRWAMLLLEQTMDRLQAEYERLGRAAQFPALKTWLSAERREIPYADLAAQLGCAEGNARVAVHRIRKRFRELFRATVAETVSGPEEIDAEMQHFATVIARGV